jgi:hypothetical protein
MHLRHVGGEPLSMFRKFRLVKPLLLSLFPTVITIKFVIVFVRIRGGQELNRNECGVTGRSNN